jgi:OmpA-OmpF porin, OOP family
MIRKIPFTVFYFVLAIRSFAQNLVPNPGFEEYLTCPGSMSLSPQEFNIPHWKGIGIATPDYFNKCGRGDADVPYNWAGVAEAFEGNAYTGIFAYLNKPDSNLDLNNYREYLQCKLVQPLIKDSIYIVEFHFKLSSYSTNSIDRIGLLLEDSMVNVTHDNVLPLQPTLSVVRDSALTMTTGLWETARMEYRAAGGEQYLVIGNFYDWKSTRSYKIQFRPLAEPMLADAAYYYIDDVKVLPRSDNFDKLLTQIVPEFGGEKVKAGKTYVLRNIQFEFNSFTLMRDSFTELDRLVEFLLESPSISIQLSGHTDDQGGDAYNQRLSLNRAQSVAQYLVVKGINERRIESFGYGKSNPLLNATTEDARKINRRVEIRFLD